jgi:uncharacterized protein (TIGR03435 family)
MKRFRLWINVMLLVAASLGVSASAQQRATTFAGFKARMSAAEFEAASVRKNTSGDGRGEWPQVMPGGRFKATNMSLVHLIMYSYDVREFQLRGVTDLMRRDRFDVVATSGAATHEADIWMMVRNLLARRFKLSLRIERQDAPAQALVFARNDNTVGPNLRKLPPGVDCETAKKDTSWMKPFLPLLAGGALGWNMTNTCGPMSEVARLFEYYFMKPVIDQTGLEGDWMARLFYANDRNPAAPLDSNIPTLGTALREQWGLKTQETRAPLDIIFIESVQPLIEN